MRINIKVSSYHGVKDLIVKVICYKTHFLIFTRIVSLRDTVEIKFRTELASRAMKQADTVYNVL